MTPIAFGEFHTRILRLYSPPQRATKTLKKLDQVLRQVRDLGVGTTADITTDLAARYVSQRSAAVCANTVRGELGYLRAAANYAIEEDWLDRAPRWRRVWPRKSKPIRKTLHSIAEIARVLAYLEARSIDWHAHRDYALAVVASHTGMRLSEILFAHTQDVDLVARIIWVDPRRRLKTAVADGPVPVPDAAVPVIRDWMFRARSRFLFPTRRGTEPWTSGGPGRKPTQRLVAAGIACGVVEFTPQSLRHSFTTHGRRRFGVSSCVMKDILRHADELTHQRHYLHRTGDVAEMVRSVKDLCYRV